MLKAFRAHFMEDGDEENEEGDEKEGDQDDEEDISLEQSLTQEIDD